MIKIMLLVSILFITSCATMKNGKIDKNNLCKEHGILMDDEDPQKINCSEIQLYQSKNQSLKWYENTFKASLVKNKEVSIDFIYSPDGRYYILVEGANLKLDSAEGTLIVSQGDDSPEFISLAAEKHFLSGIGDKHSGKVNFRLDLNIPRVSDTAYQAKFEFNLDI